MAQAPFLDQIKRLKSLADIGLLYAKDEYDKERYTELREIAFRLLNEVSDVSVNELKMVLPPANDYPTAKVDIRGLALNEENKILLVQESLDGKWSLPGGWADIGYSPKETIVKEFLEETGLEIEAQRLLAVFDKRMHPHPPQPFYVYKLVFLCKILSATITPGFDVLDVQYFGLDELPGLSEDRILRSQLELLYKYTLDANAEVYVD